MIEAPTNLLLSDRLALSREKAAIALDIGLRTLDRLTADGEIPCVHIGKSVRYDVADLREFLARRKNKESTNV